MLIDIDDALLARHQELMMKMIQDNKGGNLGKEILEQRATELEREQIVRKIMGITTTAYFKRGDNEKG